MSFVYQSYVLVFPLYVIRMSLVCARILSVYTCMPFVCHSYVIHMSLVYTRMSLVCYPYVTHMYLYVIRMSMILVTRLFQFLNFSFEFSCHSYALVCHPYVTRMNSYAIRMSLVFSHMLSVYHSYVFTCHPYVTRMYL